MSQFAFPRDYQTHHGFIYELVKTTNCRKYLELGLNDAIGISKIANIVDLAVGVDIRICNNFNNFNFVHSSTDDFFVTNINKFDIIFIDADHNFESVIKDFENSLKILNKYGIILLHDTDPMLKYLNSPDYCGDSYKMVNYIRENHKELQLINLPISEAGLTIISRIEDQRHLQY